MVKLYKHYQPSPFNYSFFDDFFQDNFFKKNYPALNIKESENNYSVHLAAPGLKKEDFTIDYKRNTLTISYEKEKTIENDSQEKFHRKEYSLETFSRSFSLPENVDSTKINAEYSQGILNIVIPKKEIKEEVQQKITIK